MEKGYIVWNESTSTSEFYGVYETKTAALKALRQVKKAHYPGMSWKQIEDYEQAWGEGVKMTAFCENDGSASAVSADELESIM